MSGFAATLAPDLALAGFAAQDDAIEEALSHLVGESFQPDHCCTSSAHAGKLAATTSVCGPVAIRSMRPLMRSKTPSRRCVRSLMKSSGSMWRPIVSPLSCVIPPPQLFCRKILAAPRRCRQWPCGECRVRFAYANRRARSRHRCPTPACALGRRSGNDRCGSASQAGARDGDPDDGRQSTHTCESARGDFQRPYQESEIRDKFRELAALVLTPDGVTGIEQTVNSCEQWTSVRELTDQLRRYGRL